MNRLRPPLLRLLSRRIGKVEFDWLAVQRRGGARSVPLIGGIIFYILEKNDRFVRFYAMQSIIFGGVWILFNIVSAIVHAIFWSIPGIGGFLAGLWTLAALFVHLAFLVILIITIVKAFTNVRWDIPYIGPIARKQIGEEYLSN